MAERTRRLPLLSSASVLTAAFIGLPLLAAPAQATTSPIDTPPPAASSTAQPTATPTPTASASPLPSASASATTSPTPGPLVCDDRGAPYDFADTSETVIEESELGLTWAGMYVLQDLLTQDDRQYVGFYTDDREMVIAQRALRTDGTSAGDWIYQPLPETLEWDSHNYISLGLDRDGALHVAGNMHDVALNYYRTDASGDVTTLTAVPTMVDPATEDSVTYPEFVNRKDGSLVFSHRNGGSGSGVTYFNLFDETTQSWSRLIDQPLFDGAGTTENPEGTWNSYYQGPTLGPDGKFHLLWVWRDTPDAATNSMLSYASSDDLVTWQDSKGEPLTTPFTYGAGDVVDPIPDYAGLLNGNARIGFTADDEVLISYHKYDEAGNSQVFTATPDRTSSDPAWKIDQVSDWEGRWSFGGGGSLVFEVQMLGSEVLSDGDVQVNYLCSGEPMSIIIDRDQQPVTQVSTPPYPAQVAELAGTYPGLQVNVQQDRGGNTDNGRYVLRWESLGQNRDLPRDEWPEGGSTLSVLLLRAASETPPETIDPTATSQPTATATATALPPISVQPTETTGTGGQGPGTTPSAPGPAEADSGSELATTGADLPWLAFGAAGALLLLGAGLLARRKNA
ncbi:BNR-4 repeat-containing protein [Pseudoclavibacter sp. AY1H1]|uniref:BNR-4 repeat-containing protein n=1 Tax=Pseudoclavibacter sp. AY1H1 TaxID=2080584 RepID=UPI0015E40C87|nr:BNR-4 repeat-containing protein [Pseudoclavibacter sp. AY1H1]